MKNLKLHDFFRDNPRAAVAFSGGTDSSYLLYAAKTMGCETAAYMVCSQFQPEFEHRDAVRLTDELKVPLFIENVDILGYNTVSENPADRCYHCKTAIFTRLIERARADGFAVLCDGTNADDDESDRPGMRALRELGIVSPLRMCGLTKAEIRRLSKEAGLFTHDKPSYACLATRIPAGIAITEETLLKIERAESALSEMGFLDFRVRLMPPKSAVLEFREDELLRAIDMRREILLLLKPEFERVTVNLNCR